MSFSASTEASAPAVLSFKKWQILMLKLRCRIKAKKLELARWTSYTRPLFTAEVIPYQEHWNRSTEIES